MLMVMGDKDGGGGDAAGDGGIVQSCVISIGVDRTVC